MRGRDVGLLASLSAPERGYGSSRRVSARKRPRRERHPTARDKPLVENGIACDKAIVHVPDGEILVVSDGAGVERIGSGRCVEIYMAKRLGFVGWPPESMSFHQCHSNKGFASKADAGRFFISTYGEWHYLEGSAGIHLFIRAPEGLAEESGAGLSGPHSAAKAWPLPYSTARSSGQSSLGDWGRDGKRASSADTRHQRRAS